MLEVEVDSVHQTCTAKARTHERHCESSWSQAVPRFLNAMFSVESRTSLPTSNCLALSVMIGFLPLLGGQQRLFGLSYDLLHLISKAVCKGAFRSSCCWLICTLANAGRHMRMLTIVEHNWSCFHRLRRTDITTNSGGGFVYTTAVEHTLR